MEVIIDGVKYLPSNVAQPTMEELKGYLEELKSKSHLVAGQKVPAEYVRDDDRGRPFDKAYDKRYYYERGYDYALLEILYWVNEHTNNK